MSKQQKRYTKGFTLMETLITVGVVAILCAIAIPSIISVSRSVNFKNANNNARTVYLAAQSVLAQMRSSDSLGQLESADGAMALPQADNAGLEPVVWNEDMDYTVTGTAAFDLILPPNTLDATVRDEQILIEYNPVSGYVYSVFYSEEGEALNYGNVSRDEEVRRDLMLGYYEGGSIAFQPAEVNSSSASIAADPDGQELIVSLVVPVPDSYTEHQDVFYQSVNAQITVRGEISGAELTIPTETLLLEKTMCIGSPNYVEFSYTLDSLKNGFAQLNGQLPEGNAKFLPGENLSFEGEIRFDARDGYALLSYDPVLLSGVSSLFSDVESYSGDKLGVHIRNGRHLQNLKNMEETLAGKTVNIILDEDVYWNETAEYYAELYPAADGEETALMSFEPLDSRVFSTDGAVFDGNEKHIYYLNIRNTEAEKYSGLFGYCSMEVRNLSLVSPAVSGAAETGALAGYAKNAKFSNCAVYIDTEDVYFSWDAMDDYGVSGTIAGALVGYIKNISEENLDCSDCFGAVPVEGTELAGGLVGSATKVSFSGCYGSGNVQAPTAGGFIGYCEDASFMRCFASGDVSGSAVAGGFAGRMECEKDSGTYDQCYAVGLVSTGTGGDADGFCGTSNLPETDVNSDSETFPLSYDTYKTNSSQTGVYTDSYYLSRETTTVESYYADPASYAQLNSANSDSQNVLPEQENGVTLWEAATEETSHRYSLTGGGVYPFLLPDGMEFYGDWEDGDFPVAVAYYETYADDDDDSTEEIGYYINSERTATLRHEDVSVASDGYVLLANVNNAAVTVKGYSGAAISARYTESDGKKIYEQLNSFYIYDLPEQITKSDNDFHNQITVQITTKSTDGENKTSYTLFYNPDFALTQINPSFDYRGELEEAAVRPDSVPDEIYVRTARHLASVAENTVYQGEDYHFLQMMDVNFEAYAAFADSFVMQSIAKLAGSYSGSGGYVDQAIIKMDDAVSLFGEISGTVKDISLQYEDACPAANWLADSVSGRAENCDAKGAGYTAKTTAADENSENSETEVTVTGGLIGTVEENGVVSDCELVTESLGADAGFAGRNDGTITCCAVGEEKDKLSGVGVGFVSVNNGLVENSMANSASTAAAFAGENNGRIEDCYAWYLGTAIEEGKETELVFAQKSTGSVLRSYAAAYGDPAYALLYDGNGVAAFRDSLNDLLPGDDWNSGSGNYPYAVPKGIRHMGAWASFKTYQEFSGYYYYEADGAGKILSYYIQTLGEEGVTLSSFADKAPASTGYGIFKMTPKDVEENLVENVALTLDGGPIVPSEPEDEEFEQTILELLAEKLDTTEKRYTYDVIRELGSGSVYVLNGVQINTWFAPQKDDGSYPIRSSEQFKGVAVFPSEHFVQDFNITATSGMEKFSGLYDGGENTITYSGNTALFGTLSGTVKQVVLKAALSVTLDGAEGEEEDGGIRETIAIGALANETEKSARIQNCRAMPTIELKEQATEGKTVAVTAYVGGLVGENRGSIQGSTAENLVLEHSAADTSGMTDTAYSADIRVGGLVGCMTEGLVSESFATGKIAMGTKATDSTSSYWAGGAVGAQKEGGTVSFENSYAAVNIAGADRSAAFMAGACSAVFRACHGWNGSNFLWAEESALESLSMTASYYTKENYVYEQSIVQAEDGYGFEHTQINCENVQALADLLNQGVGSLWTDETVYESKDEQGNVTSRVTYNVGYPVLTGLYDSNARVTAEISFVTAAALDSLASEEPQEEVPADETAADTATDTENPETTAAPAATEAPEATELPVETETPAPVETAEPEATESPVPTEEPVEEQPEESAPAALPMSPVGMLIMAAESPAEE